MGHSKTVYPITHGHASGGRRTPTYRSWEGMKARCRNLSDPIYGGRGITYDPRWASFEAFVADMGDRPEGTTLERRDNALGYTKANCAWATAREQTLNRSITRWITHGGRTMCLSDWARELGVSHQKLLYRINAGWPVEKTLT